MAATTHTEFNEKTEGLEVAKAFSAEIRGKNILVTGVNRGGIGFSTAEAFASQSPAHLIIAGRTPSKLRESIDLIRAQFPKPIYHVLKLDLSTQKTVREAAEEIISWSDVPKIDIIVNSAGVMFHSKRVFNEDGIEITFATNHVGHFLFTCLLMPKLVKASESNPKGATRIVNVSSGSPKAARMRWSDLKFEKKSKDLPELERPNIALHRAFGVKDDLDEMTYLPLEAYNQSKVANVLFGIALTSRMYAKYGILSNAVHPGVILTELTRNMEDETRKAINSMIESGVYVYKTLGAGASTSLVAALDPRLGANGVGHLKDGKENHGAFLDNCQISDKATAEAVSSSEAEKLWKLSEELVRETFEW